jgi:transcriptional regulator with XRE-family HTH domain
MNIETAIAVKSAAPAPQTLSLNIARLRRAAGLGQDDLAMRLNWSQTRLAAVEAGSDEVHLDDIDTLATALGVAPADLFERFGV